MLKSKKPFHVPRITALDLLRGYFLIAIILNHAQWYPNGLDWVAFQGSMLVTAAEGFFLISGILLGLIRGRKLLDKPFRVSALIVLKRGVQLYAAAVILMLLFTVIGWFFMDNPGLKPGIRPMDQPIGEILLGAFSLQYIYGWADFLRLYAIFLIMTPLAILALRKGKWYLVAAVSILLWALFPFALANTANSAEILMILSYQLVFFAGLIIGFHWTDVQAWWRSRSKTFREYISAPLLGLAAATLILNMIVVVLVTLNAWPALSEGYYRLFWSDGLFHKESLPVLRLALFALWFSLGLTLFTKFEAQIKKWLGWILLPFGTNSLYVYIMHALILFLAHLVIPPNATTNVFANFIASILLLGLILLAVRSRFLFKIIPR